VLIQKKQEGSKIGRGNLHQHQIQVKAELAASSGIVKPNIFS
jgi:hypothetical protein